MKLNILGVKIYKISVDKLILKLLYFQIKLYNFRRWELSFKYNFNKLYFASFYLIIKPNYFFLK